MHNRSDELELLLKQLMQQGQRAFIQDKTQADIRGASNEVKFGEMGIKHGVARSNKIRREGDDQHFLRVQKMLQKPRGNRKRIKSPFLQTPIAYSITGERFFYKASEFSLEHFLAKHQKNLTIEQIKHIFGQIVLAVKELHDRDFVHRDLKNLNILIDMNETTKKIHAIVADLDFIAEVNEDGTSIISKVNTDGSIELEADVEYSAYETLPAELIESVFDEYARTRINRNKYALLDLKAVDCYGLGVILSSLLQAKVDIDPEDAAYASDLHSVNQLKKLEDALLYDKEPAKRAKINDILNHEAFANVNQSEEKISNDATPGLPLFFQNLINEASELDNDLNIDGYLPQAYNSDYYFLLLVTELKPIYKLCENLIAQIKFLQEYDETIDEVQLAELDKWYPLHQCELETLEKKYAELNAIIKFPTQSLPEGCRVILEKISQAMQIAVTKIRNDINDFPVRAANFAEIIKIKTIVKESVAEYLKKMVEYHQQPRAYFSRLLAQMKHGIKGKQNAEEFLTTINQSKLSVEELYTMIEKFLQSAKGDWNDSHSFKTILRKNLGEDFRVTALKYAA